MIFLWAAPHTLLPSHVKDILQISSVIVLSHSYVSVMVQYIVFDDPYFGSCCR